MKLNLKTEDLLLGIFVLFGLSYPFIIGLVIFIQDMEEKKQTLQELRNFYTFLLGFENCSKRKAYHVLRLLSENLQEELGGEDGLLKTCLYNKKVYKGVIVKEKLSDSLMVVELLKDGKKLLSMNISYQKKDEGLKILEISYEKGY
ncbi:hypothetical protein [Hydrogenobacter hydrogenophilus]|uniref:Uncharacterized protein n=1 Tax=Hydrogenobacter hydrogenophilus TaxID=35835 RepID=A0A285P838_9AQUI|nr:hypothetical protein [Hydrogenobacter hydrogenophilus]SNZ16041.1 hypothetical protein SAMN06265353_1505 [Hydrogenobacter hydrogenophilus]